MGQCIIHSSPRYEESYWRYHFIWFRRFHGKINETKIKKQQLVQLLSQFKYHLEKQFPEITIASELRKENFQSQLELIFSKLKKVNFIDWEDEVIKTKEILYHIPKSLHNLKKSNIVLYHKNQLTAHLTKLEQVWNQLAMETGVKT